MFFLLSKILLFFTYPLVWILILFILAFIYRKKAVSRKLLLIGTVLFLFFSNSTLFQAALSSWEGKNKFQPKDKYDAVIILGGYSSWNERQNAAMFNESADRLIRGVEIYKLGKAKKIILSGGSGQVLKPKERESDWIRQLLLNLSIPDSSILLDTNSRNTYENALEVSKLIVKELDTEGDYLLITSAFHMRRAKACFEKTRLNIDYLKTDFLTDQGEIYLDTLIIPSAGALDGWQMLIKEILGYVVYWLRGYF